MSYQLQTPYTTAGAREDVLDLITQVDPEETPLLSRLGVSKAGGRYHEWLNDTLESGTGTGNSAVEGAAASLRRVDKRSRSGNICQISTYTFGISGTQEAIAQYGLDSEYSYQLEKAMKILKIMQEQTLMFSTYAHDVPSDYLTASAARTMRGVLAAITTNVTTGSACSCALTETAFNNLLQDIFTNGNGRPDTAFVNGFQKRRISSFSSNNVRYINMQNEKTLRNTITAYESDFGTINVVLDRWAPKDSFPVMAMEDWKIAYLRKPFVQQLGITGDSKEAQILVEYTLEHLNEGNSGKVSSFATS
jgi:hypothetical protein